MTANNTETELLQDKVTELAADTIIQHGSLSDRIYMIKRGQMPAPDLAEELYTLATRNAYSKIIAKVPSSELETFINLGYTIEALIPGYFPNGEGVFIIALYLSSSREKEESLAAYRDILQTALSRSDTDRRPADIEGSIRKCTPEDVDSMVELYQKVFPTYPFPITDTKYVQDTMNNNVDYYCIETAGAITALASAEIDYQNSTAEMTDFATQAEFRGQGFAFRLLGYIESATRLKGIQTFYTIARAGSYGMNITFAKSGYRFGGRLKNNTNIAGQIESMNIWYKGSSQL